MKSDRPRDKYPLFYAFGDQPILDSKSIRDADVNTRIKSIWPFMARRVRKFYVSLKPREQANCDPEDILLDLYAMLVEKDGSWDKDRGKYITYAGRLIGRELLAIRDRARTVQSPRNATSRMKEYKECEDRGTLSDRRRETYEQLSRTVDNATSMPAEDIGWRAEDDHVDDIAESDLGEHERAMLRIAVRRLSPKEAAILGWAHGLWGSGYCTHEEIARRANVPVDDVREIKAAAYAKIRWYFRARKKAEASPE